MVQDLRANCVARFEHCVDVPLADRALALAQQVEQVLLQMGQRRDVSATQHGGAALDGVHGAEYRVQIVRQWRIRVQPQQDRLHVGQVLLRFLEEDLTERVGVRQGAG